MHESWLYNPTTSTEFSISSWSSLPRFLSSFHLFVFLFPFSLYQLKIWINWRCNSRGQNEATIRSLRPTLWSSHFLRVDLQSGYLLEVFRILYGYSIFLVIYFRVIDVQYSEFLMIGLLYLCSELSGFFFIFGILVYSRSNIRHTTHRDSITDSSSSTAACLSDKEVISGQYYMASFEDLYGRKCRCLYSDYCTVDLGALSVVIHILIGIILIHVLFVFISPIKISRTKFL